MPTVLRVADFAFSFYSNEHEPAHVHATNGDGTAVIEIQTGRIMQELGQIRKKDVRRAVVLVAEHKDQLQSAWTDFAFRRGARK
ncbi:DUF4160 domain-containing protein [Longimicrobium sp.]|uniref:DUF4160 domain-containing protein n=1 Tax=Longimicrobium sp. TaxID=2029185 RepID=UPI003B3AD1F1